MNFQPIQSLGSMQRQFVQNQGAENGNPQNPVQQPYFVNPEPSTYARPLSNGIVQPHGNFHSHSVNIGCPPPPFSSSTGQQSPFIQPQATLNNRQPPSPALNVVFQQPPQFQQGFQGNSSNQISLVSNQINQPPPFQQIPTIVSSSQPPPHFSQGPPLTNANQQTTQFQYGSSVPSSNQQTPQFQYSSSIPSSNQQTPQFQHSSSLPSSNQQTPQFQYSSSNQQTPQFQHSSSLPSSNQQTPQFQYSSVAHSNQQTAQFQQGPMISNAIQQPPQVQPVSANQQFYQQPILSNVQQQTVMSHVAPQGPQLQGSVLSLTNNSNSSKLNNPGQFNFQQSTAALGDLRQQPFLHQGSEFKSINQNRFHQNQYERSELRSNQRTQLANDRQLPLVQPGSVLGAGNQSQLQYRPPMNNEQQKFSYNTSSTSKEQQFSYSSSMNKKQQKFSYNSSINNQSVFSPKPRLTNFQPPTSPQRPMGNNLFSNQKSPHRSMYDSNKLEPRHISTTGLVNTFGQSNSIAGKGKFHSPMKNNSPPKFQNNFQERQTKLSFASKYVNNNQDSAKSWIQFPKSYVNNELASPNKFNNGPHNSNNSFHHNNSNSFHLNNSNSFHHNNSNSFHHNYANRRNNDWNMNTFKSKGNQKRGKDNIEMPYSCDTCDRAFITEADLKRHFDEHIKCKINGCQFEAHYKVVALHQKMQHETGYAEEISKLNNADEIEKWRSARRSRFPTAENIKKRKAEQAEKEARGEVLETKEFGKFKKSKTDPNDDNRRTRGRYGRGGFNNRRRREFKPRNPDHPRKPLTVVIDDSDSDDDSHIKLPKFRGLLYSFNNDIVSPACSEQDNQVISSVVDTLLLEICSKSPFSDNVEENSSNQEINNASVLVCEGDSASSPRPDEPPIVILDSEEEIIKISDSDSSIEPIRKRKNNEAPELVEKEISSKTVNHNEVNDSDDEPPSVEPIYKCVLNGDGSLNAEVLKLPTTEEEETHDSDDDAPIEEPIVKSNLNDVSEVPETEIVLKSSKEQEHTENQKEKSEENAQLNKKSKRFQRRTDRKQFNRPYPPPKPTLLEKLLADDIRHERNVILQCVRHIVKNNFFDK